MLQEVLLRGVQAGLDVVGGDHACAHGIQPVHSAAWVRGAAQNALVRRVDAVESVLIAADEAG
ncbi:hypothetical protein D4765_04005 [Subtercola vilae]|uniref:Uncharacterized protein n=1 Tax=Subtercola vilae TaxID=2056433 RepID=A0A4T2C723_9MICO|nr:hypothetical protein D4765_04005 [Subtercola vilae]